MMAHAASTSLSKRSSAGFFSSAATFFLPIGPNFDGRGVHGYYIDLRIKTRTPVLPLQERRVHVAGIQWGLGSYERYLAGEGEMWLDAARQRADELVESQHRDGPQDGGFLHQHAFKHTFPLRAPWISAMAQGEAASLLVRIFQETGEERYAEAARRALAPLSVAAADGGACAMLEDLPYPEEYPTQPPSFVLNGGIFALWGVRDVAIALQDGDARAAFEQGVDTLAKNLYRWDLGYWSRYDLFPHPTVNVASSFYHHLHITQLRAMHQLVDHRKFGETADRWAGYAGSSWCRKRAFAGKALFRVLVPRNRLLATRLPWSPMRGA
jgi:heparosan-N-sulfate-glucuronate 5-epimerase